MTLFYDGSRELYNDELDDESVERVRVRLENRKRVVLRDRTLESIESNQDISNECKEYMKEIVVLEGVTEIPERTFRNCKSIKRVIFADTVIRVGICAFDRCTGLVFVKWSINLGYIGEYAFYKCNLSSVFIPLRCREICARAFQANKNLSIFHVPQDTELGTDILPCTAIARASCLYPTPDPMRVKRPRTSPDVELARSNNMNQWLKNMNNDETCALHRACTSYQPLKSFHFKNRITICVLKMDTNKSETLLEATRSLFRRKILFSYHSDQWICIVTYEKKDSVLSCKRRKVGIEIMNFNFYILFKF